MKRLFLSNLAGRVEMSGTLSEHGVGTTAFKVEPRRMLIESWSPTAWRDFHKGDSLTVEESLNGTRWSFRGVVLHKRLNKLVLGEVL